MRQIRTYTPKYGNRYDNPDHLITQSEMNRQLETLQKELIEIWSKLNREKAKLSKLPKEVICTTSWSCSEEGQDKQHQCSKPKGIVNHQKQKLTENQLSSE